MEGGFKLSKTWKSIISWITAKKDGCVNEVTSGHVSRDQRSEDPPPEDPPRPSVQADTTFGQYRVYKDGDTLVSTGSANET